MSAGRLRGAGVAIGSGAPGAEAEEGVALLRRPAPVGAAWAAALLVVLLSGATGAAESPEAALAAAAFAREWLVGALMGVSALGPAAAAGAAVWAVGAGTLAFLRRRRRRSKWREVERMERALYVAQRKRRPRS